MNAWLKWPAPCSRDEVARRLPRAGLGAARLEVLTPGHASGASTRLRVRLDDWGRLIEGVPRADGPGDVAADPGRLESRRGCGGARPPSLGGRRSRGAAWRSRAVGSIRSPSQALSTSVSSASPASAWIVGNWLKESLKVEDDGGDRRLDQHHLRDEDVVRIPRLPPEERALRVLVPAP